jgi:hypothetical protein
VEGKISFFVKLSLVIKIMDPSRRFLAEGLLMVTAFQFLVWFINSAALGASLFKAQTIKSHFLQHEAPALEQP